MQVKVSRPPSLPTSKYHMRNLKLEIISLINTGEFIKPEYKNSVEVLMVVPRTEQEILLPLSPSSAPPGVKTEVPELSMRDENLNLKRELVPGNITLRNHIHFRFPKKNYLLDIFTNFTSEPYSLSLELQDFLFNIFCQKL